MDNEIDTYLSTALKNWATRQQPPGRGREHLLRLARNSALVDDLDAPDLDAPTKFIGAEQFVSGKSRAWRAWPERPMLVTRRWSLGIATTYRFVA